MMQTEFNQNNINSAIDLLEQYEEKAKEAFISLYNKGKIKGDYSAERFSEYLNEKKLRIHVTGINKYKTYFELSWPNEIEEHLFLDNKILFREIFSE
jgi:hypothetical protein